MKKSMLQLLFSIFIISSLTSCHRLSWQSKVCPKNIEYVIVTGNFIESRLLAEIIQAKTNQPVLLLSADRQSREINVLGPNKETFILQSNRFSDFLNFTHPKQIIFLGNEKYSPSAYSNAVNKNIKKHILNLDDWMMIAWQVEEIMQTKNIANDYEEHLNRIQRSGLNITFKKHIKDYGTPETKPAPEKELPIIEQPAILK